MKKLSVFFLIILMAISFMLVSCDGSDNNSSNGSGGNTCSHTSLSGTSVVKDATCTEAGIIGGTCSNCGSYATRSFAAYGHNIVDGMCTVCGEGEQ